MSRLEIKTWWNTPKFEQMAQRKGKRSTSRKAVPWIASSKSSDQKSGLYYSSGEVKGNFKNMLLKKKFQLIMAYLTFGFCNSCFGRLGQIHFWIRIQEIILNPNASNILKITREIVDCVLNNNFQTVVEIWNILAKCIRKFQKFSCWK